MTPAPCASGPGKSRSANTRHKRCSSNPKSVEIGEWVIGGPYKDTAGPAVNPMIKITNIVALLLLAVLAR